MLFPSISSDSLLVHFAAMFKLIPRFHASLVGMHQQALELVASCTSPVFLVFSKKKAFRVVFIESAVFPSGSSALCSLRLILSMLILSRAGLVPSYVALLPWVAHREEGILLMLVFGLEEIGSIFKF